MLMSVPAAAFTSSVLSNPKYQINVDGINYVETSVSDGGTQKIFYGEYNTTADDAKYEWVIHNISDGNGGTKLSTVMNIAKDYEAKTGRRVMLATNGDYFYNTGANVESYVNNGIVITKGNMATKNCIGFDNNGKVVVGRMTETATRLVIYDKDNQPIFFEIDKFNQQPAAGEIAVYNTAGTYTVSNAGALIVKTDASNLTSYPLYGTDYTMTATGVQASKTFSLKSGQYAIVYTAEHNDVFKPHAYGDPIDLVEVPAGQFAGCTWVLGGYDVLVNNNTVNTNCHTDNSGNANAPRTFIGFKADGTGFLCVVDGRGAGGSTGITVNKEAQLASVLGAQYALELDGGGSSTMIVRINGQLTLRNTPSDGSMRKVSNAIMLVEHEHEYVEGECRCGEVDPNYVPPHEHNFVEGKCECGESDPNYVPPHEHDFVEGKCECGEVDPNYVPPHVHNFVEGKCQCGESDPDYKAPEETPNDPEVPDEPEKPSEPVAPEQPKLNFFQRIWQAILNFFRNLFK